MSIKEIRGVVIHGAKRGRTIGFPTANISLNKDNNFLENGVYAAVVTLNDNEYAGVANVGTHPTIDELTNKQLEVFIFDFDRDIYGEEITVKLLQFIRGEKRYSSIEELKKQIEIDAAMVKEITKTK